MAMLSSQAKLPARAHAQGCGRPIKRFSVLCHLKGSDNAASHEEPAARTPHAPTRRSLLAGTLTAASGLALVQLPLTAGPAAAVELPSLFSQLFSPQPVRFPRKPLDQRFAVLLMRSSYEAVDQLDFIPMNDFQRLFWLLRQSEVESYNLQYAPLKPRQGELTDPLYFDFISFSQYATIAREMGKGRQVFEEYCEDCEGEKKVVRRDPAMADNALLPAAFGRVVGDMVYAGLRDGFEEEVFGAPAPCSPSAPLTEVAQQLQQLLNIMVDKGYALKCEVDEVAPDVPGSSGGSLVVRTQGPATMWGLTALSYRRAAVANAFDAMVTGAYLRASGRECSYSIELTDVGVEHTWQVA